MIGSKLLLVFGLLSGVFAEQCDIGDFAIDDFSNHVVVTNISSTVDAFAAVKTNHGQVTMALEAGKSRTAIFLAATKYTVNVGGQGSSDWINYKDTLLRLRDQLQDLTLSSKASPDQVANAATDLTLVQSALEQLHGSNVLQSCGGDLVSRVTSQVTVRYANGPGLWVLDCG